MKQTSKDYLNAARVAVAPQRPCGAHDGCLAPRARSRLGHRSHGTRLTISCVLAVSIVLMPTASVQAQDLDRAVGALIGAIIGGAIQEQQRQRQQTTRQPQRAQPQRAQPARPAVSQAQRQQTRDIQTALNFFGFPAGAVDGAMGPNTRNAIRGYQQAMGFPVTGTLDASQQSFLIGSYHRARNAGAIPRDSSVLQQQGPQGLLRLYRDEMRGVAGSTGQPRSTAPGQFGQADPPVASQPRIMAESVGTPGTATPVPSGAALLGPHAVIDPELDTYRCLGAANRDSFTECLRAAGVSEPAVRAAAALSRDGANQYVVEYVEVGPVDVAVLQWPAAGLGITYGFVVGGAEFLPADTLFRPMEIRDGASRSLARRYPRAAAMNVTGVAGHRFLDDGGQRFVLATPLTDGCRACDVVGTAVGYVDFRNDRVAGSGTIGWAAQQGQGFWDEDGIHRRLAARDVREMQTQLNLRGYIAGAMDGAFGPNTARAVQDFRREHCLGDDADWTRETVDLLAGRAGADLQVGAAPCGPGPRHAGAVAAPAASPAEFPLRDGVYARSVEYCEPDDATFLRVGDAIGFVRREFEGGVMYGYESACRVDEAVARNGRVRVRYTCSGEGETWPDSALFKGVSDKGFTEVVENDPFLHEGPDFLYSEIRGNVGFLAFQHCDVLTAPQAAPEAGGLALGIYAEHPGQCPFSREPHPPADALAMARPLSVGETSVAWDHAGCEILSQRRAGNVFTFDLSCQGEQQAWRTTERIERLSDTDVLFQGVRFRHCGPTPGPQRAGPDGRVPLPVQEGVYASLPEACPAFDGTPRSEAQQAAASLRVVLRDGEYRRGKESCPIVEYTEANGLGRLGMGCMFGDTPGIFNFQLNPLGPDRFEHQGAVYQLCHEPVGDGIDIMAGGGAAPQAPRVDPLETMRLTAGFFDAGYLASQNRQHLGADYAAPVGTLVRSPVTGIVVSNNTKRTDDADLNRIIIRDDTTGHEHVLGHIDSDLEEGATVRQGEIVGAIVAAGTGPHLHWGINRTGVAAAIGEGWGWGRAPSRATAMEASTRGWIDPEQYREVAARSGADPEQPPAPLAGNPEASLDRLRLASRFLDPQYAASHGKQLLGLDLRAEPGTHVLAPISGMIMGNRTGPDVPPDEKWLILRDTASGQEHVFGHLVSPLQPGDEIGAGQPLGEIADGLGGRRLHWGINRFGIWQAVDTAAGWGWGHGPPEADAEQVRARGWIDPATLFPVPRTVASESSATDAAETRWAPEVADRYPRAKDFAAEFPDEWRQLRTQFSLAFAEEMAQVLLDLMQEFDLKPVMRALWDAPGDSFAGFLRQIDPQAFSAGVLHGLIGPQAARFAVEDYARRTGAEVDTELVLGLSSVTAQLTLAGMTGTVPLGLPVMSFNYARRLAARPYEEDERFEIVSEALLAADRFRRLADGLDDDGKPRQAAAMREFADNIVAHAAEQSVMVFRGADGPVVAELLRGMDEVIRLVRADRRDDAEMRFLELHRRAEDAAPGFFSLSTNNWYQRYFMIGAQRQGGTVRAFRQLDDILQRVLREEAEIPAAPAVASSPAGSEAEAGRAEALSAIEAHFTAALGVDSDYVQLQLIDAGFYSGALAPFGPDGRHSQWTPSVQRAFEAALDYARQHGIEHDLSSETGYYAFVGNVRTHRLAGYRDDNMRE